MREPAPSKRISRRPAAHWNRSKPARGTSKRPWPSALPPSMPPRFKWCILLPTLEARERTAAKLEDDLTSARTGASAIALELKSSQALTAALGAELKRSESAVSAARSDSTVAKTQASAYLELLRSREWRRGFDLNLFREMDARVGAADTGRDALQID